MSVEGSFYEATNESDVTGFSKCAKDRVSKYGDHSQFSKNADYLFFTCKLSAIS